MNKPVRFLGFSNRGVGIFNNSVVLWDGMFALHCAVYNVCKMSVELSTSEFSNLVALYKLSF